MNVALYARVSSAQQAERDLSISAQLKALREYASVKEYMVAREFIDEAESGRTTQRPAFREMIALARLKSPPFGAILVWKLSRFARSREDSILYKSLLRRHGIQVISINEPVEDSPVGRLLEGVIESIDEFYSANLGQDVLRGMRENAAQGFFNGSRPPYGYARIQVQQGKALKTKLEPDAGAAPIVKRIFHEAARGNGLKEIAKALNREGVRSPSGGRWGTTGVHRILTNEAYVGRLVWGRRSRHPHKARQQPVVVEEAWPSIVDPITFQEVRSAMHRRSPLSSHPRREASRFLLSGLARCGHCGAALIGHGAKSGRFLYYVCGTTYRKGSEVCAGRFVPKDKLEASVTEKLKDCILSPGNMKALVRMVNEELDSEGAEAKERLKSIDRQISETDSRLGRLYDALEGGRLHLDDLAPRIIELRRRRDALLEDRRDAESLTISRKTVQLCEREVASYVRNLSEVLGLGTLDEQKSILKSFVESVQVWGSQITINYTLPAARVSSETDQVLDIVPLGEPNALNR